jgi:hypothetical protein
MIIGQYKIDDIYGNLKIIEDVGKKIENNGRRATYYKCLCLVDGIECEKFVDVKGTNLKYNQINNCNSYTCNKSFNNLLEQRFEKLLVVGFYGFSKDDSRDKRQAYWECLCDCGFGTIVSGNSLMTEQTKSCGCLHNKTHMEITGKYFSTIKNGAKNRDIAIHITIEDMWDQYIKQDKKCELTGVALLHTIYDNDGNAISGTASLDRIDSDKDYTKDNIQWVHKVINEMRMDQDQNSFIEWCKLVAQHNKDK